MITVQRAIELLQRCNPSAIVMIAQPDDGFCENILFVEEVDEREVHFCDTAPTIRGINEWTDDEDFVIEVIAQEPGFAQIKTNRAAPPKLNT